MFKNRHVFHTNHFPDFFIYFLVLGKESKRTAVHSLLLKKWSIQTKIPLLAFSGIRVPKTDLNLDRAAVANLFVVNEHL